MVFISKQQRRKTLFLRGFILKPTERTQALLKNGTRDFQNSPPLETLACFSVTITENFKLFQYFNIETDILKNENLFQKTGVSFLNCLMCQSPKCPYSYFSYLLEFYLRVLFFLWVSLSLIFILLLFSFTCILYLCGDTILYCCFLSLSLHNISRHHFSLLKL